MKRETKIPKIGAIESTVSHFKAVKFLPTFSFCDFSIADTVLMPSEKSCAKTATANTNPKVVETWKAKPIPRPSKKLWRESRPARKIPLSDFSAMSLWVCECALSKSSWLWKSLSKIK